MLFTTYIAVGTSSVPTNTAVGAISTSYVAPGSQAFGNVTASATSGLLTFTTSLAAVTCASAGITNTHVATSSLVFLSIQDYTGSVCSHIFILILWQYGLHKRHTPSLS